MSANLEKLQSELEEYLDAHGMVVFRSFARSDEGVVPGIYWDTRRYSGFRDFVDAAVAVGVRLMSLHAREFTDELLDEAMDQLAASRIDRSERRTMEQRLRELRAYEGFLCQIELSFDYEHRTYIYDLRTEWFEDLNELVDRIEDSGHEVQDHHNPLGGYYSNN